MSHSLAAQLGGKFKFLKKLFTEGKGSAKDSAAEGIEKTKGHQASSRKIYITARVLLPFSRQSVR